MLPRFTRRRLTCLIVCSVESSIFGSLRPRNCSKEMSLRSTSVEIMSGCSCNNVSTSGRQDLNLRPLVPQTSALTKLSYIPEDSD